MRNLMRPLRREPGVLLLALLVGSLAVGAAGAVFALYQRMVLAPLPYEGSESLVSLSSQVPREDPDLRWGLSAAQYFAYQDESTTLQALAALLLEPMQMMVDGRARGVTAGFARASLFQDVLPARPALGRLLAEEDQAPGRFPVAMLTHGLWEAAFGADPAIVGRHVEIEGMPMEVVGVLAPGYEVPGHPAELWLSFALDPAAPAKSEHQLAALGRMRPGIAPEDVLRDLTAVTARLQERHPDVYSGAFLRDTGFRPRVELLRHAVVGGYRTAGGILLVAAPVLLLMGLLNITNLLIARAEARRGDIAVRAALGARRVHFLEIFGAEAVLLTVLIALGGVVVAAAGVELVAALAPPDLPRLSEIGIRWSDLLVVMVLALVLATTSTAAAALRYGGSAGAAYRLGRLRTQVRPAGRSALVAVQLALAVTLVAGAVLLGRTSVSLTRADPGFAPGGVLVVDLNLPRGHYDAHQAVAELHGQLHHRLEAIPGVVASGATRTVPLRSAGPGCSSVFIRDRGEADRAPCVKTSIATAGYFDAMGIRLSDGAGAPVSDLPPYGVVVTGALAARLWPGENPVGKGIRAHRWEEPFYTVAAVADDIRGEGLDQPVSEVVYFPVVPLAGAPLWNVQREMTLVIGTTAGDPREVLPAVDGAIADIEPRAAVTRVETMDEIVRASTARTRYLTVLVGIAALIAVVVAGAGIYGLTSYMVRRRQREFGIRTAVGANAVHIRSLVVSSAAKLALAGGAAGMLGAVLANRMLQGMVHDVALLDPLTLGAIAGVLSLIVVLASYRPAAHAAGVDPMEVLRSE